MTETPLPDPLMPYEFLLGTWEGEGVGGVPRGADFAFAQELSFTRAALDTIAYASRVWSIEGDQNATSEAGFWRALPERGLEIVASHSEGLVEISLGSIAFTRIETVSDVVARTGTGAPVTAIKRLYGMVGDELMYAVDMATAETPLSPRFSGRLRRVVTLEA